MSVVLTSAPKLGTTYTVYSVHYNGVLIHRQISKPEQADLDDIVRRYLSGPPKPREATPRRQVASQKTLWLAGNKAKAAAAFRRETPSDVPGFYIEGENEDE